MTTENIHNWSSVVSVPPPHRPELERQRRHYAAVRARFASAAMRAAPPPKPAVIVRDIIDVSDPPRRRWPPTESREAPKIEEIKQAVCQHFGIGKKDIEGPYRDKRMVRARHILFWLARDLSTASHPEIGRRCGGRDHSTVYNGLYRITADYARYADDIAAVRAMLGVQHNG